MSKAYTSFEMTAVRHTKMVPYVRVSTDKQGESGLGLEAQQEAINGYAQSRGIQIIRSFTEVESGKNNDRPELAKALAHARRAGATVVIAKLDRLTRNARFLLELIESGADVAFCELPELPPGPIGKFFLTMMVAVAELEVGLISDRTKKALGAYKARGGKLGAARETWGHVIRVKADGSEIRAKPAAKLTPELSRRGSERSAQARRERAVNSMADLADQIQELRARALSYATIADMLNREGHSTPRGKSWRPAQVKRVLDRLRP